MYLPHWSKHSTVHLVVRPVVMMKYGEPQVVFTGKIVSPLIAAGWLEYAPSQRKYKSVIGRASSNVLRVHRVSYTIIPSPGPARSWTSFYEIQESGNVPFNQPTTKSLIGLWGCKKSMNKVNRGIWVKWTALRLAVLITECKECIRLRGTTSVTLIRDSWRKKRVGRDTQKEGKPMNDSNEDFSSMIRTSLLHIHCYPRLELIWIEAASQQTM